MGIKLKYALKKDNKIVHISDVESGLKCDCICPSCKSVLVAKKGKTMNHHFAHHNSDDCGKGYETVLHLLAKEILAESSSIEGPTLTIGPNDMIVNNMPIKYDKVEVEKKIEDIVADIVVFKRDRPLIIEIFVTHKVDEEKKSKIIKLGISALEIDLSSLDREIEKEELKDILLRGADKKTWIYNKPLNDFIKKEERKLIALLSKHKIYRGKKIGYNDYLTTCPKEKRSNWRTPVNDLHYGGGCCECEYFQGYKYKKEIIHTFYKKDYPYKDEFGWYDDDGDYYNEEKDIDKKGYYHAYDLEPEFVYCGYKNKLTDYNSYLKIQKTYSMNYSKTNIVE